MNKHGLIYNLNEYFFLNIRMDLSTGLFIYIRMDLSTYAWTYLHTHGLIDIRMDFFTALFVDKNRIGVLK